MRLREGRQPRNRNPDALGVGSSPLLGRFVEMPKATLQVERMRFGVMKQRCRCANVERDAPVCLQLSVNVSTPSDAASARR